MLEIKNIFLNKNIVLKELPDENKFYALNISNGDCFELTDSAFFILNLLYAHTDNVVILKKMLETFHDLTYEKASRDLRNMLNTCHKLEIICATSVAE